MNKLEARWHARKCYPELFAEIRDHLGPSQTDSRERIMEVAIEKMRGISGTNLAARVTEASEAAILEELHKAIEEQMRGYMKWGAPQQLSDLWESLDSRWEAEDGTVGSTGATTRRTANKGRELNLAHTHPERHCRTIISNQRINNHIPTTNLSSKRCKGDLKEQLSSWSTTNLQISRLSLMLPSGTDSVDWLGGENPLSASDRCSEEAVLGSPK